MSGDESNSQQSNTQQPASPSPSRRRSSFTTNRLSEMFNSARNPGSPSGSPPNQTSPFANQTPFGASSVPNNASATGRRISISTLGLSGSGGGAQASAGPNSAGGAGNMWGLRRSSISTGPPSNASSDESAIDDSADAGNVVPASGPAAGVRRASGSAGSVPPGSPFGRRMSFGARAMGQMRGEGQGFNWADNLRTRQSRSGSAAGLMSGPNRIGVQNENLAQPPTQPPAAKEPAPAPAPRRESQMKKPDHFQERILKGDFYMD